MPMHSLDLQQHGLGLHPSFRRSFGSVAAFVLRTVLVIAVAFGFAVMPSYAAQSGDDALNGAVTDTQNLLGSQSAKINDEISSTHEQAGVYVRLLFLADFGSTKNPEKWVSGALESTKPKPNTVMLAVASDDGRLVVAVSNNSDQWLKKQKNVDDLSQAALGPLQGSESPNWTGSAIAFMEQIQSIQHHRQVVHRTVVIVLAVVVLLLACIVVCMAFVKHSRKHSSARHRRSGRSH